MISERIGLERIHAFIPPGRATIEELAPSLELGAREVRMFTRFHGMREVAYAPHLSLFDLLAAPAQALLAEDGVNRAAVRYLVHAHTHQQVAPASVDVLGTLKRRLGLGGAHAFAVTQANCASGLLAVDVVRRLLAFDPDPHATALVVTGEKPFTRGAKFIPGTTVMGESSAAVLVSKNSRINSIQDVFFATDGRYYAGLFLNPALGAQFDQEYVPALTRALTDAAQRSGIRLDSVALILPHNVNRSSWSRVAQAIGFPLGKVFVDTIPLIGHCFCSDPFINYVAAAAQGKLEPGDTFLLATVGLGRCIAIATIRH